MTTIIVHVLNDDTSRPSFNGEGSVLVQYKARREGGEEVHRQAAVPASEDFNAYVSAQALEEAGGMEGDVVRLFGGVA
jgi:hypothetical protein